MGNNYEAIINSSLPRQLAEEHVDWLLRILRPILVEEFIHGYKHGVEDNEPPLTGDNP